MNAQHGVSLKRGINKWELVLLFINSVIGAGIFGLPSKLFAISGVYSLLAFIVCAAAVMVFILCFAEVSSQFDETGGPYLYAHTAFGRLPAFLTGWLLILSRIFNYATLVNLLVVYCSYFNDVFSNPLVRAGCILLFTTLFGYINYRGVKNATHTSTIFTLAKLLPLTFFIVTGLFFINPSLIVQENEFRLSSFTTSVLLLIFAFGGFESMLINTGEIQQPRKHIPFALVTSAIIVAVYYCLIQLVCIGTLPALATSQKPLADAARGFTGPWGGSLIAVGAVISITGTLNVLLLSGSRLPFALSVEKQLPDLFAYVHPTFRTPTYSLLAMCLAVTIVSLAWSFLTALAIASIIRILVYLVVCASLIKLRRQHKPAGSFFRIRYGYFFASAGILLCCWLLTASKWIEIVAVFLSLLTGVILYIIIQTRNRRQATAGNA